MKSPADTFVELPRDTSSIDLLVAQTKEEIPALTDEVLRSLDNLDDPELFGYQSIIEIIGVFAGIKPGAHVNVGSEIIPLVEGLGLIYVPFDDESGVISRYKIIADEIVDQFMYIRHELDGDQTHFQLGELLGYPKTSTEHYLRRVKEWEQTGAYPEFVIPADDEDPGPAYHEFVLSPENHTSEIKAYSIPLREAVSLMAPMTFGLLETNRENHVEEMRLLNGILAALVKEKEAERVA